MKASQREINPQLNRLSDVYRAVLLFGPNEGLVRERANKVARQIVEDASDPFRISVLDHTALKGEPGLLADEAAAISMTGGRRLVRVDAAGDNLTGPVDTFLKNPMGDGLVLITAGDMAPRSSLRKLFEAAKNALAIPCYEEDQRSITDLIDEVLAANNLSAEADATAYLSAHLGGDRMVARSELEKLALYMGPTSPARRMVTREDVMACIGDSAELAIDEIAVATSGGEIARLDKVLFKAFNTGENPISVIRAVTRRLTRMHLVAGLVAEGMNIDQATRQLQPPVFFKDAGPFRAHLSRWSVRRLSSALALLLDAERDCKTTGFPAEAICARTCLRIANAARSAK